MATNVTWLQITVKLTDKRPLRIVLSPIMHILKCIAGGTYHGNVYVHAYDNTGTALTGQIACTQLNAAGKTITFTYGGLTIVFTEGTTGAQGFARGASNTTTASALAAAITAHPVLGTLLAAVGSVGNVNLTSKLPANTLAALTMTTNDGTAFSFTQLTGATIGVATVFPQHLPANKTP